MAPRKGETAEEKITRMYHAASTAITKAQYKAVCTALKDHPQHIPAVHRQLVTLGALQAPEHSPRQASPTPQTTLPAICDDEATADTPTKGNADTGATMDGQADSTGGTQEDTSTFVFDKNLSRVEHLFPTHLESALSLVEPAALSKENLKKILKKGCREFNRKELQKLWEYMTGESPSMPLSKDGNKTWDAFVANGKLQNMARGRRLADVVLPIDWYTAGLFNFDLVSEGVLQLTRKGKDYETLELPVPKNAMEFRIEQNWSENGAVLIQVNGPLVQPLATLFRSASHLTAQQPAPSIGPTRIVGKRSAPSSGDTGFNASAKKADMGEAKSSDDTMHITIDAKTWKRVLKQPEIQLKFNPKAKTK